MVTKTLATRPDGTEITASFIDEDDYNEYISLVSKQAIFTLFSECSLSDIKRAYHSFEKRAK